MGKKIWPLDKLHRVLALLVDDDLVPCGSHGGYGASRSTGEPNLLQMLQNERVTDRDPTTALKELHFFNGPYIYIYDVFQKVKPIMVREYKKVANKADGDWPQFRSVSGGRCPFVEDVEMAREARAMEKERAKKAAVKAAAKAAAKTHDPHITNAIITGKRTLAQMEGEALNRVTPVKTVFEPPKPVSSKELRQNAFTSRAVPPRLLAGEPVASGLQQSKVTSAIQSQVISSTTGTLGAKAGTSKEVQGLQRAVLQRQSSAVSQDVPSRPVSEYRAREEVTSSRSVTGISACKTRQRLNKIEENVSREIRHKRTKSQPAPAVKPKKRDPKPGYCENCQDKFDDFDEVCNFFALQHNIMILTLMQSILNPASTVALQKTLTIGGLLMNC